MNLHQPTVNELMPSPLHVSEPRNPAEYEIKRLIEQALSSGVPKEYDDISALMHELRHDMHQRISKPR